MQKLRILWYKLWAKAVSSVINLFSTQSNFDIENSILIIGSTRSGTTFLMESLNAENEYRTIFEPFNPTYTSEWRFFSARHYIDPENANEGEKEVVDKILRGDIRNHWVDQYNRKIRSDRRIIKAVRANLMLDYIQKEYPDLPIIYLYRNPDEVVVSRIRQNFDAKDVHLILEHKDFLAKYYSDIDVQNLKVMLSTAESCHAALWCLENRFILRRLDQGRLLMAKYNDVIGKTIGIKGNELVVVDKERRPSVTSSTQERYELSEEEKRNIGEVLKFFGVEKLYD